ncbi:MAG: GNAT family N-acetyltransferase [Rhodospirillaceae bacterium]|nr:GNAT family N-acetyltransferase [Rhodospirillaceae bacterium]MBT5039112.1 GNAT family N-acetyltransferase [Rhodospirillaceae bacterium]MBT5675782.1 GNAT family N-acetyltransferase [Rhodospirillaceae bacterium]MBT5780935.1 GNAT family N-acetyltransferase [Rhodospirillaceae bacterium]MBT7293979.1 GNAT family N-acetyltransferase [Rhodospirillaceae bacterium]
MSEDMMIRIRTAEPSDAGPIAEMHVATWRIAYAGILPDDVLLGLTPGAEQRNWARIIATIDHEFTVHVAEAANGELLAYGSAGPVRPNGLPLSGEVYTLYVSPDHQGQGLGRELLFSMFARLQAQGFGSAMLWVLAANPARFFYHAMGGAVAAERRESHFGVALDEVAYAWPDLAKVCRQFDMTYQGRAGGYQ